MKRIICLCLISCLVLLADSASAQRARKLPADAYIKSAKIEIISGDPTRVKTAIAMLDSLFMNYGPHADGLYWMAQIMVDYVEKGSGPEQKREPVRRMLAYLDSIKLCCNNPEVDEKFKKRCDTYTKTADSLRVKYWSEFYNAGVENLNESIKREQESGLAEDSASKAFILGQMNAKNDTAIGYFTLAVAVNGSDPRAYTGTANGYARKGNDSASLAWKLGALERSEDRLPLLLPVAFSYISTDRYCDAIPYMSEYLTKNDTATGTMYNLSICYNRCEKPDSALAMYRRIIATDPKHGDALASIGRHYFAVARAAGDSAGSENVAKNEKDRSAWESRRNQAFDSAGHFLKQAFEAKPDDAITTELYAVVSAVREDFGAAAVAFTKLTEIQPENPDHWTALGDVRFRQKKFADAIPAYEKVVEIDPQNRAVMERLYDLYKETGATGKADALMKKIQATK